MCNSFQTKREIKSGDAVCAVAKYSYDAEPYIGDSFFLSNPIPLYGVFEERVDPIPQLTRHTTGFNQQFF